MTPKQPATGGGRWGERSIPVQITLKLPRNVHQLLQEAAQRRSLGSEWKMTPETLAADILCGVLLRGSIDKAVSAYNVYKIDKAATASGKKKHEVSETMAAIAS